jgi:hypothetical protein
MKSPINNLPNIPLLDSLEDLGSLGIYDVKPFRDWKNPLWRDKIFSMRLCNVGEGFEILENISSIPEDAKSQAMKIEILARSIYMIDNTFPISSKDLQEFNEKNSLNYDQKDYLILWFKNIEQAVLNRLDAIYAGLQMKQLRELKEEKVCDNCGTIYKEFSENSKKLKYSISELLCEKCLTTVDLDIYDFETTTAGNKDDTPLSLSSFSCPHCLKEMNSFEEYNEHILSCEFSV